MRETILFAVRHAAQMRRFGAELDCWTEVVSDGQSALAAARRIRPAIAVVDAVLPGLDGVALADALMRETRRSACRIVGGASFPGAAEAFYARGIACVEASPWDWTALEQKLRKLRDARNAPDWRSAEADYRRAALLLDALGMRASLRGREYLAWAAALRCECETRDIGKRVYAPVAERMHTTPQNVERLIRHAIESAMNRVGAEDIYRLFGNSIDPSKGKPTNAQMIAMLREKLERDETDAFVS